MTTASPSFDTFREDLLVQQWNEDMTLRRRVQESNQWRGCVGVALMIRDFDAVQSIGERQLYANDDIQWAILRDLPSGMFPGVKSLDARGVNYASLAQASISRYGVPMVDAGGTDRNWNFRFKPFSKKQKTNKGRTRTITAGRDTVHSTAQAREFAVLNLLSSAMTEWAYTACDAKGRPYRKPWNSKRPDGLENFQYRPWDAFDAFPEAVVGFTEEQAQNLYWAATESPNHPIAACPSCGAKHSVTDIRNRRFFESGDFVGECPTCGEDRKYFLGDTTDSRSHRRFTREFKKGFCSAVADRLPVYAPCDIRYDGKDPQRDDEGLVRHHFVREDGKKFSLRMLPQLNVAVKPGAKIEEGDLICHLLPKNDNMPIWSRQRADKQWATLHTVVPRRNLIPTWCRQWFEFQAVRIPGEEGYKFWPSDLVYQASRSVAPSKLYWDLNACVDHVDMDTESVILPPVRIRGWDDLQFTARQTAVMGDVNDRRFRFSPARRASAAAATA